MKVPKLRRISEKEAFDLAGDEECPVLRKEESEELEAAVCLKRFPKGYVLGVSDKTHDLEIWITSDGDAADAHYENYVRIMGKHGTPFGKDQERS